jgi:hypothetical protein
MKNSWTLAACCSKTIEQPRWSSGNKLRELKLPAYPNDNTIFIRRYGQGPAVLMVHGPDETTELLSKFLFAGPQN